LPAAFGLASPHSRVVVLSKIVVFSKAILLSGLVEIIKAVEAEGSTGNKPEYALLIFFWS
jgi:hypothetical protein